MARSHKTIALLIALGADVDARTYRGPRDGDTGETPLDMAERFQHPHVAALLHKHGAKRAKEL